MSYSYKPKPVLCTLPTGPKHKWEFVKNYTQKTGTITPAGAHWRFTLKGHYKCGCGQTRAGQPRQDQPGADVRLASFDVTVPAAASQAPGAGGEG